MFSFKISILSFKISIYSLKSDFYHKISLFVAQKGLNCLEKISPLISFSRPFGDKSPNPGSISSTFYEQLLRAQIPNAQKRKSSQQCHLALLGPMSVKAARKSLVKLTLGHPSSIKNFFFRFLKRQP